MFEDEYREKIQLLLKKQKEKPLKNLVLPKKKTVGKTFGIKLTESMTKTSRTGARDAWKEPTVDSDMYKTESLAPPRPFTSGSNALSALNPSTPVRTGEQRPFSTAGSLT